MIGSRAHRMNLLRFLLPSLAAYFARQINRPEGSTTVQLYRLPGLSDNRNIQRNPIGCLSYIIFNIIVITSSLSSSVMDLGHLLIRSCLTYPEVSSKVCHDSFYQLGNSVPLSWIICYEAFCLHVVPSFSCILVICLKFVLFWIPLQFYIDMDMYSTRVLRTYI
jgi:hypothetical protein